jgi:hypothetical protein
MYLDDEDENKGGEALISVKYARWFTWKCRTLTN